MSASPSYSSCAASFRAFEQPAAIAEAAWLRQQFRGFAGLEIERGQLAVLEAQQFDAGIAVAHAAIRFPAAG